jgi:hypothetical protein
MGYASPPILSIISFSFPIPKPFK